MRAILMMALLALPANAAAAGPENGLQARETPTSAAPWIECIRKVGRDSYARQDDLDAFQEAIDEQCGDAGEEVNDTHPNVYRLSRREALETYAYCIRRGNGGSQRCRTLRGA